VRIHRKIIRRLTQKPAPPLQGDPESLRLVCARYGLNFDVISGLAPDVPASNVYIVPGPAPDGLLRALRVIPRGRLGNNILQVLNALLLAQQIGVTEVQIMPTPALYVKSVLPLGNLTVLNPRAPRVIAAAPFLAGPYFWSASFPAYLQSLRPDFVKETVETYLRPAFADFLPRKKSPCPHVAVAHFRAGDIFETKPHHYYVQPPASFYLTAIAYLIAGRGAKSVLLVAENRRNPVVAAVEAGLRARGIPFSYQSRSVEADFGALCGASHLVASFSTFCVAAAILSNDLQSYVGFRNLEPHAPLQGRQPPLLDSLLLEKGVHCAVVEDAASGYIPPFAWANTPDQIQLMLDYPAETLRLVPLFTDNRRLTTDD
jgi:hypothetical protein